MTPNSRAWSTALALLDSLTMGVRSNIRGLTYPYMSMEPVWTTPNAGNAVDSWRLSRSCGDGKSRTLVRTTSHRERAIRGSMGKVGSQKRANTVSIPRGSIMLMILETSTKTWTAYLEIKRCPSRSGLCSSEQRTLKCKKYTRMRGFFGKYSPRLIRIVTKSFLTVNFQRMYA